MWRKHVIIFSICFNFIAVAAQDYSVVASFEKDTAWIGEQFHFTIEVISGQPLLSVVPLDDKLFPDVIEIISATTDSIRSEKTWKYISKYLITGFDSGFYYANAIPVLINTHSSLDTIYTNSLTFVLKSPEVDTTKAIMDIREPINTPFVIKELLPYAPYSGAAILIGMLVILWFYYLRKKKSDKSSSVPSLPAHIKALEALDLIKNQKLWQKGEVKEYYSQLSDTIRTYLEERFQIPAMESVTADILLDYKTFSWEDDSLMEILESLLQLSDLVKFAKEDPLPSDNEMNLNNAYIFVEKTKPVIIPSESADSNK